MRAIAPVAVLVFAVCLIAPLLVNASFYDNFDDLFFRRDSNNPHYDANDPNWTNPNNPVLWDADNPDWNIYVPLDEGHAETAKDGWLYLWAHGDWWPWAMTVAYVDSGDHDPNTSRTFWDDSASHYVLARVKNLDDPNRHRGRAVLFLNVNEGTWTGGYEFTYEFYKSPNRLWGVSCVTGMWWTNMASGYLTPLDEVNGFWILLQFNSDGNPDDPNGKYIQATCWDGDKYDGWNGSWINNIHLGADPNTFDDPNAASFYSVLGGRTAIASYGDTYWHEDGYPSNVAFDEIEARTGTFSPEARLLQMQFYHGENGTVSFDPDLTADPNVRAHWNSNGNPDDPNVWIWVPADPNGERRYTNGTEVALTAEPLPGKTFLKWKYWDPCSPGTVYEETNAVLYLTMDSSLNVEAQFKCGNSVPPFVGMTLLALAVGLVVRRRLV